jgi:anti-sigma factor RsiW
MRPEAIAEWELDAYLDGELDSSRALAVEDYLAQEPEAAARVMKDMALQRTLRLAQPRLDIAPAPLLAAASKLAARLNIARQRRRFAWLGAGAAAALIGGVVAFQGPDAQAHAPAYVSDAVQAYRTGLLRADMPSQIEAPRFDKRDVRRFTQIRVPVLPAGWEVTDVQLFPSEDGPALQIMIRTSAHRPVSIFAVRSAERAPAKPVTIQRGRTSVAYWRHGDMAYALTGMEAPRALDIAAADLADNRID